ncbi:hypothetical protein O0L34_g8693 [Tuta absoluta]|nr:hypothetical protein O0L34_g8693 [Tuta absoluta]
MARILLLVVLIVTVKAAHKHHPKFPKTSEEYETTHLKRVACSTEHDTLRNNIIQQSKCGAPKDVFEYLEVQGAHLQISPNAVWVKRCVGLCDYDTYGSKCVPLKKRMRSIPVRIYNVKTFKESCMMHEVEEHLSCGCCAGSPEECAAPQVFDPPEPEFEVESI